MTISNTGKLRTIISLRKSITSNSLLKNGSLRHLWTLKVYLNCIASSFKMTRLTPFWAYTVTPRGLVSVKACILKRWVSIPKAQPIKRPRRDSSRRRYHPKETGRVSLILPTTSHLRKFPKKTQKNLQRKYLRALLSKSTKAQKILTTWQGQAPGKSLWNQCHRKSWYKERINRRQWESNQSLYPPETNSLNTRNLWANSP